MNDHKFPRVGVALFVFNDKYEVLLGKRISKIGHGDGEWSLPGGHLEMGETPEEACRRELFEETSLVVLDMERCEIPYTSDVFPSGKHYITLFFEARQWGGNVNLEEPEKCAEWGWFPLDNLPTPLFLPIKNILNDLL